jgi:iron-sulfur cluster repair protein YtfE (RIC family)
MDLLEHLTKEHRAAEELLRRLEASEEGRERETTLSELSDALAKHMAVEERFLYPIVAETLGEERAEEASVEHDLARDGLTTMEGLVAEVGFKAAVAMLTAGIAHHVAEEEHDLFPQLRERARDRIGRLDPEQLEQQVDVATGATRDELYQRAQAAGIPGRSQMTKQELIDALAE